jgi:hypothetical protein
MIKYLHRKKSRQPVFVEEGHIHWKKMVAIG